MTGTGMSEGALLPDVIETERLVLRPFRFGDEVDVLAYARDPEWSRFLRVLPRPYEPEHAEQFVARQVLLNRATHPAWAVTFQHTVIGGVNLRLDVERRSAEIGYSIARTHWKQGICTEAADAVVNAAFRTHPDLLRIHARADAENVGSQRVMEKLGMQKEGVLRSSRVERGEVFDEAWFSILRKEWEGGGG